MVKTCVKCGVEQPIENFYRHRRTYDGRTARCKPCTNLDLRVNRTTSPRAREYDRKRNKLPHRAALISRVAKAWGLKHPDRLRAQLQARYALRIGRLIKPTLCEGCALPKRLEQHHHDYSRPLAVVWLCKTCHVTADNVRRRLEAIA